MRLTLVAFALLAGVAPAAVADDRPPSLSAVKLGSGSLTAGQEANLRKRLDRYAFFEGVLAVCGRPSGLLARAAAAAAPCVEQELIDEASGYFTSRMNAARAEMTGIPCNNPDVARILDDAAAAFDDLVREIDVGCRACRIC
jgi:hypothetical protein